MRGLGCIFIEFQGLEVTYPLFSRVLILMVCLFSFKSVQFARYRGLKVLGYRRVPTKFHILFLDFEVTYPPPTLIFKCFDFDDVFTFPCTYDIHIALIRM